MTFETKYKLEYYDRITGHWLEVITLDKEDPEALQAATDRLFSCTSKVPRTRLIKITKELIAENFYGWPEEESGN